VALRRLLCWKNEMAKQHGDFIWYELLTNDASAATDFYRKVVGWHAVNSGQADMTSLLLAMGKEPPVAGLTTINAAMKAGGAQPCWLGHICVDDVDASADNIRADGGIISIEPQDIPNIGRFAMALDPQGAPFCIMRGFSNETCESFVSDKPHVGRCTWNELLTGWRQEGGVDEDANRKYHFIYNGPAIIGAVMPKLPEEPSSRWLYYFRAQHINSAIAAILDCGGSITQGPDEIPGGDFSMRAIDPQGAHFALVGQME
jgi:uncharacterized protein